MPKTRKLACVASVPVRGERNSGRARRLCSLCTGTGDVANVLLRLLPTEFQNGFSELTSTDGFSFVSDLRSCSSISRNHSSQLLKEHLPLEAGITADSLLNTSFLSKVSFFPSLVLALTKEKGHNLFLFLQRHQISQDDNFCVCFVKPCAQLSCNLSLFDNAMTRIVSS